MSEPFDIAVIGAGPAGMAAATLAAGAGARVVLLDENAAPGGQVHRASTAGGADPEGDRLRAALAASGATIRCSARIWGLGGGPLVDAGRAAGPFAVDAVCDGAPLALTARALILCTGTHERVIPFPGWTLPGVIGLAGATILLKAADTLPGQRVVVAGCGPLLAAVAAGILQRGGSVAAVVDLAARSEWVAALPSLATRPGLLAKGLGWLAATRRAKVPMFSLYRVAAAHGMDAVDAVEIVGLQGGVRQKIACDALCVGHGLIPATEAVRLFRARMAYRPERGGFVPVLDKGQRTSVALLYAAGDTGGLDGGAVAPLTGRLAALSALHDLRLPAPPDAAPRLRHDIARARRFAAAMARMMRIRPGLVEAMPDGCVVCRCEDVTKAEIAAAIAGGASDVNQLKQFTRCGMGPCQGRFCAEAAGELVAAQVGGRAAAGQFTARLPLRPVPMAALLGDFDYADIPVPAAAPI